MVKVMNVGNFANALLRANICAVPCLMPSKRPALPEWTKFQKQLPSIDQHHFNGAIGIITGKISGNIFVLDIDVKYDLTGTLVERLQAEFGEELSGRIFQAAYIQKTINGGLHIFLRCEQIEGNLKLAQRQTTAAEREKEPDEKVKVLLETRGDGGFIVVAPTEGYEVMSGELTDIGFISIDDKERLFEICRSFNEVFTEVAPPVSKKFTTAIEGLPPWEDYDQRADVTAFLLSHGWTFLKSVGKNKHFTRPGKKGATSGTYNEELNLFRCFSTSTQLEADKSYRPSALFTFLECNGNFEESARKLYSLGYGERFNNSNVGRVPRLSGDIRSPVGKEPLRMTFKYKKKNSSAALSLNGTVLVNFGEIFVIVGLPGQGKTAICEGTACAGLGQEHFGFAFNNDGRKVLLADTERHPDDVSDSYRNIFKRLRNPKLDADGEIENLIHLSLAEFGKVDDLKFILQREISTGTFSLIILDGIIDFANSMNDDKDATDLVKWVRMLAVKYNCAIVVTIHPNKGSESIAGHLGAFLYRWARAILYVRTVKGDRSIKELTGEPEMAKLSHGSLTELNPVHYTWDPDLQLLMPCTYEPPQDRGKTDKMRGALSIVFAEDKRYRHGELVSTISQMGHSITTAKRWIKSALNEGLIDNGSGIYKRPGPGSSVQLGSPPFI